MRECNSQPAVLVASCQIILYGNDRVAVGFSLRMRIGVGTNDQYYIVTVIHEFDTVCVNALRSMQCLLRPVRL